MDWTLKKSAALTCSVASFVVVLIACAQGNGDAGDDVGGGGAVDAATLKDDSGGKAAVPGKDSGSTITPVDDSGTPKDDGATTPTLPAACTAALKTATYDFEGDDQGWTHTISDGAAGSASWPFDPWTRGTDATCPDGQCFGAERGQNYSQCQRGELKSPKIDLSACKAQTVTLVFDHAFDFWFDPSGTSTDGGILEISSDGGSTWTIPTATYPGTLHINPSLSGGYACVLPNAFYVNNKSGFVKSQAKTTMQIDLPAAAISDKMQIRFSQASGVSSRESSPDDSRPFTGTGWRIDNVHFTAK